MTEFKIHNTDSAPADAKPVLEAVTQKYGFVPNLIGGMSEAPAVAEAYVTLAGIFGKTSFSETERQVVMMTANRLNGCHYCMAAHTTISKMSGVPDDVLASLREGSAIADAKLEALRQFTAIVVESRGWPSDADVNAFTGAGYNQANVLEVILGVSLKTLSNYTNHVIKTPVDDAFSANAWSAPAATAAE